MAGNILNLELPRLDGMCLGTFLGGSLSRSKTVKKILLFDEFRLSRNSGPSKNKPIECDIISPYEDHQLLREFQLTKIKGTYVQCCNPECGRFAYNKTHQDPATVPHHWLCAMAGTNGAKLMPPKWEPNQEEFLETNLTAGSLVWARSHSFPWWPGMIDFCPDSEEYYWLDKEDSPSPDWYHVIYIFKDKVVRQWIQSEFVTPFATSSERQGNVKQSLKSKYIESLEIVEGMKSLSLHERLKAYSFMKLYKGKLSKPDRARGGPMKRPTSRKEPQAPTKVRGKKKRPSKGNEAEAKKRKSCDIGDAARNANNSKPTSTFPPRLAEVEGTDNHLVPTRQHFLDISPRKSNVVASTSKGKVVTEPPSPEPPSSGSSSDEESFIDPTTFCSQSLKTEDGIKTEVGASTDGEILTHSRQECNTHSFPKPPFSAKMLTILAVQNIVPDIQSKVRVSLVQTYLSHQFPYFESRQALLSTLISTVIGSGTTIVGQVSQETLIDAWPLMKKIVGDKREEVQASMRRPYLLDTLLSKCIAGSGGRAFAKPPLSFDQVMLIAHVLLKQCKTIEEPFVMTDMKAAVESVFPFFLQKAQQGVGNFKKCFEEHYSRNPAFFFRVSDIDDVKREFGSIGSKCERYMLNQTSYQEVLALLKSLLPSTAAAAQDHSYVAVQKNVMPEKATPIIVPLGQLIVNRINDNVVIKAKKVLSLHEVMLALPLLMKEQAVLSLQVRSWLNRGNQEAKCWLSQTFAMDKHLPINMQFCFQVCFQQTISPPESNIFKISLHQEFKYILQLLVKKELSAIMPTAIAEELRMPLERTLSGWKDVFPKEMFAGHTQPPIPPHLIMFMGYAMMLEISSVNHVYLLDVVNTVQKLFPFYRNPQAKERMVQLAMVDFLVSKFSSTQECKITLKSEKCLEMCQEMVFISSVLTKDDWKMFCLRPEAVIKLFSQMSVYPQHSSKIDLVFLISLCHFSLPRLQCCTNKELLGHSFPCLVKSLVSHFPLYSDMLCNAKDALNYNDWLRAYRIGKIFKQDEKGLTNVLDLMWLQRHMTTLACEKPLFYIQTNDFYAYDRFSFPSVPLRYQSTVLQERQIVLRDQRQLDQLASSLVGNLFNQQLHSAEFRALTAFPRVTPVDQLLDYYDKLNLEKLCSDYVKQRQMSSVEAWIRSGATTSAAPQAVRIEQDPLSLDSYFPPASLQPLPVYDCL